MRYSIDPKELNARPVPQWFKNAKFGIFVHWGLYSVPAYTELNDKLLGSGNDAAWYKRQIAEEGHPSQLFHNRTYGPNFQYEDFPGMFEAELFDADEWAKLFKRAGARYMNFTSKHHDGFCMYPSSYAWKWNSVTLGPHRDFCMELRDAMDRVDVKFGVYHSLLEFDHPLYVSNIDAFVTQHLHPMMKELVCKYEPWTLFTDGEWRYTAEQWGAPEFLAWLYNDSPVKDVVVPNDRWGIGTRGNWGGNYTTEYGHLDIGKTVDDCPLDRPFEECRGIGRSFGLNRLETPDHYMSVEQLLEILVSTVARGGNLLLNVAPAGDGRIPTLMQERLLQIGRWLEVNGDAIYDTDIYIKKAQTEIFYTKKDDAVYAILSKYPFGSVVLDEVPYSPELKAEILACQKAPVTIRNHDGKAELCFPPINPDDMDCGWMYAIKLTK